ncbi:MAG: phosphate ABC transporter permease PstA [Planctomycetaceae bacterium]|nr:phosphate ABC transporter permease PstA [Planctomycetaceae bacterium]
MSAVQFATSADVRVRRRFLISSLFRRVCALAVYSSLLVLSVMLTVIAWKAWGWLDIDFIRHASSAFPEKAGILAGIWGTFWLITLTTLFSVPVGIGAAVYLEEYATDTRLTRTIKVNLSNLAGVPSIVYGMLGLTVFVRMFGLLGHGMTIRILGGLVTIPLPFGKTVIAGALTMTLLILPVVIISAQEALRAVPKTIRVASFALGATRWQTIRNQVLPAALPGIVTGTILAVSRAMGETAPLIMVGAISMHRFCPAGISSPVTLVTEPSRIAAAPFDVYTTIPITIYSWIREPATEFKSVAAAGIVVLIVVLSCFNGLAVFIRQRARNRIKW